MASRHASNKSESRSLIDSFYDTYADETVEEDQGFESKAESSPSDRRTQNTRAVSTCIDTNWRGIFPFDRFNRMQSQVFDTVYEKNLNLVISAPTGSGKTVIFELAMVRLFTQQKAFNVKAVYIAPLKSLVNEKATEWSAKFQQANKKVLLLTGDSKVNTNQLNTSDIICTTPEKIDSLTRRWKTNSVFMDCIGLLLVDEIHLIGEERGACLEGLITRCMTRKSLLVTEDCAASEMRIIAVSATIPNVADIAEWISAKMYIFGSEHRPVPLKHHVVGKRSHHKGNEFLFDKSLNYQLWPMIKRYSSNKPTLVFCSTRKGCEAAAKAIIQDMQSEQYPHGFVGSEQQKMMLKRTSTRLRDKGLKEVLDYGIGLHTAGLNSIERQTVERLFFEGHLRVICATSTLAQGVNLPAHLVIIKSTKRYVRQKGWEEYNKQEILQMIGRAGRPQFDKEGVAVILTSDKTVKTYSNLLDGQLPIESNLRPQIVDHLNAEVALETVRDEAQAIAWINSTFLKIRMRENPKLYGSPTQDVSRKLAIIIKKHLAALKKTGLLTQIKGSSAFVSSLLGQLMAKYYLRFETVKLLSSIESSIEATSLIRIVAQAEEFKENCRIRLGEKAFLNGINKGKKNKEGGKYPKIKYPMKGKISEVDDKIYVLLQYILDGHKVEKWDLSVDVETIFRTALRILNCTTEYLLSKDGYQAAKTCLLLRKTVKMRMWHSDKQSQLRQLPSIGPKLCTAFQQGNIRTLKQLEDLSTLKIEDLANRKPPFGIQIRAHLKRIPRFKLIISDNSPPLSNQIDCKFTVLQTRLDLIHDTDNYIHLLVGQANKIILHRRFKTLVKGSLVFHTTIASRAHPLNCCFIYEDVIGYDQKISANIGNQSSIGTDTQSILSGSAGDVGGGVDASSEDDHFPKFSMEKISSSASTPKSKSGAQEIGISRPQVNSNTSNIPTLHKSSMLKIKDSPLKCKHNFKKCLEGRCSHKCCVMKNHPNSSAFQTPKLNSFKDYSHVRKIPTVFKNSANKSSKPPTAKPSYLDLTKPYITSEKAGLDLTPNEIEDEDLGKYFTIDFELPISNSISNPSESVARATNNVEHKRSEANFPVGSQFQVPKKKRRGIKDILLTPKTKPNLHKRSKTTTDQERNLHKRSKTTTDQERKLLCPTNRVYNSDFHSLPAPVSPLPRPQQLQFGNPPAVSSVTHVRPQPYSHPTGSRSPESDFDIEKVYAAFDGIFDDSD